MQPSAKGMKGLGGATKGKQGNATSASCGDSAHPLEKFDNLLKAFDGFIGGSADGSNVHRSSPFAGVPFTTNSSTGNTSIASKTSNQTDVIVHEANSCTTKQHSRLSPDDGGRLPRLYSRSSSASEFNPRLRESAGVNAKRRRTSRVQPSPATPQTLRNVIRSHERGSRTSCYLHDNPLNLMLRSKGKRRPDREDLQIRTGSVVGSDYDDIDSQSRRCSISTGESGPKTMAGVFRLADAGTGFVHYGYSWDIAGAEADQLRLLGMEDSDGINGTSVARHQHRGLSALVRAEKGTHVCSREVKPQDARQRPFRLIGDASRLQLRFEVVRRVPLPTRFRASDFETQLREICTQELLRRRAHVLVLVAQHYKRSHAGPAFRHTLVACGREVENKEFAAALEIQRVWWGHQVRRAERRERQMWCQDRLDMEKVRVSATIAVWIQARHRGHVGRRRARGLRDESVADAAAREKQASENSAVTIREWLRSVYQRRRMAAAAADKAANEAFLLSILGQEEEKLSPSDGKSLMGETRGPPRPISASEARVASHLCDVDTKGSISTAQEWTRVTSDDSTGDEMSPVGISERQQLRRPSSSRETRHASTTPSRDDGNAEEEQRRRSPFKSRGIRRPSSAVRPNTMLDEGRPAETPPEISAMTLGVLPDASRLVLEGDPRFTAAMAIQAAWRGFIARMSTRKRRRAAAALRRKREGKWRQQRGVVGKRVAVAWDERRDFEEGGEEDGARAGRKSSCIEIQVFVTDLNDLFWQRFAGFYHHFATKHLNGVAVLFAVLRAVWGRPRPADRKPGDNHHPVPGFLV